MVSYGRVTGDISKAHLPWRFASFPSPGCAGPTSLVTLMLTGSSYLGPSDGGGGDPGGHTGERGRNPFIGDMVGGGGLDPRWHFQKQTNFINQGSEQHYPQ